MKTIMIVDEENESLEKAKYILENNDYQVVTANNNREALEIINDEENSYYLILVNTLMPGSKKKAFFSINPLNKKNTGDIKNFLEKPFTDDQLIDFVKKDTIELKKK